MAGQEQVHVHLCDTLYTLCSLPKSRYHQGCVVQQTIIGEMQVTEYSHCLP